jgi:hypothetical protein
MGLLGLTGILSPPRSWSGGFEFSEEMTIQCFSLEMPVGASSTPSFGSFTFSLNDCGAFFSFGSA